MIKSVLVLAPHQDDELNIVGLVMDQLKASCVDITVCFITNGDYSGKQETRLREARTVAAMMGGWKIILLGYGDGGYEGKLLNVESDKVCLTSPAGRKQTYGLDDIPDFHFTQHGEHAEYTRENLFRDIKELLLFVRADLVFCVAEDKHPDHKLLSKLFDKAMEEIVYSTDYHPLVLKKFAYLGTWYGEDDYFIRPMVSTKCISCGGDYETRNDCKPYEWEKRVRFIVNPKNYSLFFWKSPLFKALKCYKSQNGLVYFPRIVNSDAVYWFFDTREGVYELSLDFPIRETPLILYQEKGSNEVVSRDYRFLKLLFKIYVFFSYRVLNKLRRMTVYGI